MKWGVPAYDNGNYYFVSLKDHVNVGFSVKNTPKKILEKLEGKGKTMRIIKLYSLKDFDERGIRKIINIK
jgi:hypothetical protein